MSGRFFYFWPSIFKETVLYFFDFLSYQQMILVVVDTSIFTVYYYDCIIYPVLEHMHLKLTMLMSVTLH